MSEVTTTSYDNLGRVATVVHPDWTTTRNEYHDAGELKKTYGSRTYPVEYTYDYAGRMKTMQTWQNYANASGAAVTTWNYDLSRGFLLAKRYQDNLGPTYTYSPGGRLLTRLWARGVTATYTYNNAGELSNTIYSDGTPAVALTYDRQGTTKVAAKWQRKIYFQPGTE